MTISKENGEYLLKIAKQSIETYLKDGVEIEVPSDCPDELKEKLGVFCTLNKYGELRGCIGFIDGYFPVVDATIKVAISAATEDPRFPPLTLDELNDIDLEITILTKPELIEVNKPEEYLEKIIIGEDGLIVQKGLKRGLLLPQVATENSMDTKEFLEHTCIKAYLKEDSWLEENTEVFKFQGQVFK